MNIAVKAHAAADADEAWSTPLAELNPARIDRFANDTLWPVFERLRREDPVHFTPQSEFGPYWSLTRWEDIIAVDSDHETFSSIEGIGLSLVEQDAQMMKLFGRSREDQIEASRRGEGSFIGLDEPHHGPKRRAVSPTVAPANIQKMSPLVRQRAGEILDRLPIGEPFDWVDKVSMELTAMTLATLFDFPFEERRRLTRWSDMFMNQPGHGPVESWEQKIAAIFECRAVFQALWEKRREAEPSIDLISMMAHNPATRDMGYEEYQGNVAVLIIGGNDTTRNTISGSVYWLNKNPQQYEKLRANPELVLPMVSETIRYQTPLAHMARVTTRDVEIGGKTIRKGDRVVMWYISGNRDEAEIDQPNTYIIDRPHSRHHMSFGFGVHRCVGNRVAEMQLTIIWEEILKRFPRIEVLEEPVRAWSSFVHGYESMQVVIPERV
ncbi:MAG TPA: cytochrome P450 [Caulobacteraceae bacterium]|jgi:cytochrome P450|nr:cytochrome P450 [Caulobacteraceae bacterium]